MAFSKISIDNYFMWINDQSGREKITIGTGERGHHYTILFKERSRVIDVHKTIELANGKKKYIQFFEMRFYPLKCFSYISFTLLIISLLKTSGALMICSNCFFK